MKSGAAIIVGSVDEQATLQQVLHGVHISQRGGKGHGTQGLAVALLYCSLDNVLGPAERQRLVFMHVQESSAGGLLDGRQLLLACKVNLLCVCL